VLRPDTDRLVRPLSPGAPLVERVLLTLEQRRARGFEDPYILGTAPPEQQRDLDRLFLDLRIVNHELGGLILALSEATGALEWRWRWFEAMAAHAADLALVHEAFGLAEPPARLTPPIDPERPEDETFAGRVPRVLKGLRDALVAVAAQAHATEAILEEFSGKLGADPLRPGARELLEETQRKQEALFEKLEEWIGPVARKQDLEEELQTLRDIVAAVRRR
jgi:hypothetical protein